MATDMAVEPRFTVTSSTGISSGLKSHFPAWQSLSIKAGRLIAHPFQGDSTAKTDAISAIYRFYTKRVHDEVSRRQMSKNAGKDKK
ncbi:hypothetical protein [Bilophila wadsworthia]|uniref:hypothetical protein n=1 Tax=Bilophila wadsworthia TaxID=35833 RepID=UPI003521CB72